VGVSANPAICLQEGDGMALSEQPSGTEAGYSGTDDCELHAR
jgi:hypothetical protein